LLILSLVSAVMFQPLSPLAGIISRDINIFGSWTMVRNATDSFGNPCPFIPGKIEFFIDNTVVIPGFSDQHLPFKTTASEFERMMIERRIPEFEGKRLLLIKPNSHFEWESTPMVYAYTVDRGELTLTLQNWSPAKFVRTEKP